MVLKDDITHSENDKDPEDWFRYAQVLGIYHANIIYVGPGMLDYEPRRMEFLWVRWYERDASFRSGWPAQTLDRLQFPPIFDDSSFGFLSPDEVHRASHIMPAFSRGRLHPPLHGRSKAARNATEWTSYYVGRFVYIPCFWYYVSHAGTDLLIEIW
jgi:hypothetical protein